MKITHKLAQDIVDKTMKILEKNINIMNENGVIIASGDKSRLNQYHEGAAQVIREGKKLEIYSKDINHLKKLLIKLSIYTAILYFVD